MNRYKQIILSLALVLAFGAGLAGCAGSQTKESTGELVDDSVVTTKVKTALVQDSGVGALDIQVKTFKGTVQLSGFADTVEEKQKAEMIARRVDGVESVANDIRIKNAE